MYCSPDRLQMLFQPSSMHLQPWKFTAPTPEYLSDDLHHCIFLWMGRNPSLFSLPCEQSAPVEYWVPWMPSYQTWVLCVFRFWFHSAFLLQLWISHQKTWFTCTPQFCNSFSELFHSGNFGQLQMDSTSRIWCPCSSMIFQGPSQPKLFCDTLNSKKIIYVLV